MRTLKYLFDNNRAWSLSIRQQDPEFFAKLSRQQVPNYLWIGCSDSRVPANQIVGLLPGELFVHRNVANLVTAGDLNCLSVLQFAVDVLKVQHVIVCGHYGCGGVKAVLDQQRLGLVDEWLRPLHDLCQQREAGWLAPLEPTSRHDRLCELNVIEQVLNACHTATARAAWARNQTLAVHGWIYSLQNGLLRDLDVTVTQAAEVEPIYQRALSRLACVSNTPNVQ